MALDSRVVGVFGLAAAMFLGSVAVQAGQAAPAAAQAAPPPQGQQPAETVFKNVTALKGVPVDEFMGTMGFISNAMGLTCTSCHIGNDGGGWDAYASDANPRKATARRMIQMVAAINKDHFAGRQAVTCVSCHNGNTRPRITTDLAGYYQDVPQTDEPTDIIRQSVGAPSADQVLDKYIQAIGGAQKLAGLTSVLAKATYEPYGVSDKLAAEVYAKAPGQFTTIVHWPFGDVTGTYDGRNAWSAMPDALSPLGVRTLAKGELEGAKMDGELFFPARLKQSLINWKGAVPTAIGDTDVFAIQGTSASGLPVKLYFDAESGLLLRLVRYAQTPIGRNPTQVDFDDYRDVAGVKVPFKRTVAWQSGRGVYELTDVKANVQIDAAKFAKPAAPASPR